MLTVRLGGAIIRGVIKHWVGDHALVESTTQDVSTLLQEAGLAFIERRRMARQLDEVTERVAERLTGFFEAEQFGGLAPYEQEAAALAVAATVERGFTDPAVALAADLDARQLENDLRAAHPTAAKDEMLAPLAERLYNVALAETCVYLIAMVEELPRFAGSVFAELLARERTIIEMLEAALEHVPRTSAEEALSFETRYMRAVVHRLDQLQLLGFTASPEVRRYQLSVAYISLSVALSDVDQDTAAVCIVDAATQGDGASRPSDAEHNAEDAASSLGVEQVIADTQRLLVRGDAGSGKTSLLHWLAVNAARRTFDPSLDALNSSLPLYISLRQYAALPLPAPGDFVDSVASAIKGLMPDGFVERALDAGRGLLLVDGVDELPADRRAEARQWLEDLSTAFPKCRYVVTSRPPAVTGDWLDELGFQACVLEPMNLTELDAFIDHWHKAIVPGADPDLVESARHLKATIRRQPPLQRLATSPLLCAMLCALHQDGSAQLPRDRIQLYDRALEALLEARDAKRRVIVPDGLPFRQKLQVLRDLSYWLVRNGYSDAPQDQVIEQIARSLVPIDLGLDENEVFEALLERTGLLRQPAVGRVDFIHRTFLEYLAAQAIVEQDDIGYLLEQATNDSFAEVIVLAAGTGNTTQRHSLISGLLEHADKPGAPRERLQLLAVASLETVTALNPELSRRVQAVLRRLVPPSTITAAKELASAGDLAVPLLGPDSGGYRFQAVQARACVRALGLIGGEASLEQIARFGRDDRKTVVQELIRQWQNFDHFDYGERVMAESPLYDGAMGISAANLPLGAMRYLKRLRRLQYDGLHSQIDPASLAGHSGMESLNLMRASGLVLLKDLVPLPALKELLLFAMPDLAGLDGVEEFPNLRKLSVQLCPGVGDLEPVRDHPCLCSLTIIGGDIALSLEPLGGSAIKTLSVGAASLDAIEFLAKMPALAMLTIAKVKSRLDLLPLVDTNALTSLSLVGCSGDIPPVPLGSIDEPLAQLTINHCSRVSPQQFGAVRDLRLVVDDLADIHHLEHMPCSTMSIIGKTGTDCPRLPATLTSLNIRADELTSLDGLPCAQLRDLVLRCPALSDLDALSEAVCLKHLTLLSVSRDIKLERLAKLADKRGFLVAAYHPLRAALLEAGIFPHLPNSSIMQH